LPEQAGELPVRSGADPHALASIVYTSGTTGRPKGVMLSHHNMLYVAQASLELIDCFEDDVFLSFLPLSHTLERTGGYYLPMLAGATVAFARSVPQLAEDLKAVRPTALIAVPRIFERVYGRVAEQMQKKPWLARKLFELTINVGWRRFQHAQKRAAWSPSLLLWPLLDRAVARKITAALGGRLRLAVSGGAALAPSIARTFLGLGVPIIQGYGLTETSPVVSVNVLEDNVPDSVGVALPGTEVRIGDNDELMVKGPGVMQGYWNRPEDTAKVIGPGGWLHTGDQARIDEGGHIHLTGRIKDILVLSNGEKIPPADMELAIAVDPLVDQVMVVGEGRPYLSALVVLNETQWFVAAQQLGLDAEDPASLQDDSVLDLVLKRIRRALHGFPGYAKIRRVCVSLDPWAIEDGLLTPTLKVKRPKVLEKYAREVDEMYASGPAA
jgi:long-chain acyl-CoA synthetase